MAAYDGPIKTLYKDCVVTPPTAGGDDWSGKLGANLSEEPSKAEDSLHGIDTVTMEGGPSAGQSFMNTSLKGS